MKANTFDIAGRLSDFFARQIETLKETQDELEHFEQDLVKIDDALFAQKQRERENTASGTADSTPRSSRSLTGIWKIRRVRFAVSVCKHVRRAR